jgi:hypothetical protein
LKVSADSTDREGMKERIASRLERIEASYGRRINAAGVELKKFF